MFGVRDRITNDILEENLEDTTCFFIDEAGDTLDTTTTSETADGGLCDTLDVVTENLAMTLGSALAEALAAFSACEDALACCCDEDATESWKRLLTDDGGG
jgi:hypothetical protein